MKTKLKVSAIILTAFVFSAKAQIKVKNTNDPKPIAYVSHGGHNGNNGNSNNGNNQNPQNNSANWQNNNGYSNGGGSVSFNYNSYPSGNWGYAGPSYNYYNAGYYGNPYHTARQVLRSSKAMINQSIDFHNWNDIYSPMLAKAIRHHNFAKQMYWWGNYNAAIAHAERAKYLAWCSLQYFQNPNGYNNYNGNNYPDPYGDPNDPYYKKGNPGGKMQNSNGQNGNEKQAQEADEMDKKLPSQGSSDKDLIRDYNKEDKDE